MNSLTKNYAGWTTILSLIYLAFIGLGLVLNPGLVAKYLSADHHISESTFTQIRLGQIGLICMGLIGTFSLLKLSRKWDQLALMVLVLVILCSIGYFLQFGLIDDTYISLRYAKNFAAGEGLVFNPGEKVEGYTCFLWVILLGLIGKLKLNLVFLSKGLSLLSGIGTVLLVKSFLCKCLDSTKPNSFERVSPIFFLVLNFPFIYWSFSGMETSLYSLLLILSTYFLLQGSESTKHGDLRLLFSSFCLGLAVLTRPEAYIVFPLNLLFLIILGKGKLARINIFYYFVIFSLLCGTHLIWRYSYYGQLLPNTYYVKVGGVSLLLAKKGIYYLFKGFYPHIILILFVILSLLKGIPKRKLYILSLLTIQSVAIIYEGGDHFGGNRYMVSIIPFFIVIGNGEIRKIVIGAGEYLANEYFSKYRMLFRNLLTNFIIFILCYGTFLFSFSWASNGSMALSEVKRAHHWANVGMWLKQNAHEKTDVLATPVAGAMPFFSELKTIDMLGLNDVHIAHKKVKIGAGYTGHEKFDNTYVLAQKPTYIYLGEGATNMEELLENKIKMGSRFYADLLQNYFPNDEYGFFSGTYGETTFAFFIRQQH